MKAIRVFLACLWLLLGVTSTAHAGMAPTMAEPPCHEEAAEHKPKPQPASPQTLVPCCNQPVGVAPLDTFVPRAARMEPFRLMPQDTQPLIGLTVSSEPEPPKAL